MMGKFQKEDVVKSERAELTGLDQINLARRLLDLAELARFPIGAKVRVIGQYSCAFPGEYIVIGARYEHRDYAPYKFDIWIASEDDIAKGHGATTDLTPDELCVMNA